MAIDKALLDQLLAGRDPQALFAKGSLIDDLKKAIAGALRSVYRAEMAWLPWRPLRQDHGAENTRPSRKAGANTGTR